MKKLFRKFIRSIKRFFLKRDAKKLSPKTDITNNVIVDNSTHNKIFERLEMLYLDAVPISEKIIKQVNYLKDIIVKNKSIYVFVSSKTGVPWQVIASIHSLEGGLSFKRILHNGEKLPIRKTRLVPKGRGPFSSWQDAAIDALLMKKRIMPKKWGIGATLDFLEKYNGLGYRKYHSDINTPYLWSGTNKYTKGKYVADGKYSSKAVSKQIGAAVLLKFLDYNRE